jgi:hypothetical protein
MARIQEEAAHQGIHRSETARALTLEKEKSPGTKRARWREVMAARRKSPPRGERKASRAKEANKIRAVPIEKSQYLSQPGGREC